MKKKKLFFIIVPVFMILVATWVFFYEQTIIGIDSENTFIDENGIPHFDYQTISGEYIGKQRNPIIIFRVANNFYQDFLKTNDDMSKKFFLNNANWIVDNTVKHENYSLIEHQYRLPNYELPVGWHDAMAQGRMINILLKAHNLTNEEKYLNEVRLLTNGFFVDVSEGGISHKTMNNGWWYEHRAHKDGLNPRILNGHMFTLLDLYSLYEYTNDPTAKFLFDQGMIALINDIDNYDFFGYSYHDTLKKKTNYNYHKIHIDQTKLLYDITNEKILLDYHNKWKSCNELCHFILQKIDRWIVAPFRNFTY